MALAARLELRQGQSLVITPQLQQAIKLLQLSNVELEAYVEGELERVCPAPIPRPIWTRRTAISMATPRPANG
jgi:hypothetical protein